MAEEKRKVTMTSYVAGPAGPMKLEATDFVKVSHLDAYVADAKTRWQAVETGDENDHGPGGEDGAYTVHDHMKGE
jgi:hypothetical protein